MLRRWREIVKTNEEYLRTLTYAIKSLRDSELKRISVRELQAAVESDLRNGGFAHVERNYDYWSHMMTVAQLLVAIEKDRALADSVINDDDYRCLWESSSLLSESAGRLIPLNAVERSSVLKSCLARWPDFDMNRKQLTMYIKARTQESSFKHKAHDSMVAKDAIGYLKNIGCVFCASEVRFSQELRIDALGWQKESSQVIGIDVKRSLRDFIGSRDKMLEYSLFCDKLYILTENKAVVDAAAAWNNGIGVLFKSGNEVAECVQATLQQSVSRSRRMDAQEAVYRKYITDMSESVLCKLEGAKPEDLAVAIREEII